LQEGERRLQRELPRRERARGGRGDEAGFPEVGIFLGLRREGGIQPALPRGPPARRGGPRVRPLHRGGRPGQYGQDRGRASGGAPRPHAPREEHPPLPPAAPAGPRLRMPVKNDGITLQGGRLGWADHFVKPNYAATLGELGGRVTGLSSEGGTVAAVDVRGRLANHSPLQVSGTINPLAAATFADIKASFRDIDLPAFTPYSGTYAGYAISSGPATMGGAYKVDNRKPQASTRFLVNQFTFGDKVESPQATKLPVKLAVSLLKDRNGVIDLDLPIEGSLDDPKFR